MTQSIPPVYTGTRRINLDTPILIYVLTDEPKSREKRLLEANPWSISAIVLWERVKLVQSGRVDIDLNNRAFVHALNRIRVWPITFEIAPRFDTARYPKRPGR